MKELFLLIRERLNKNESIVLVTITNSSGSVPRGAGARMLVGRSGDKALQLWGSIGGGTPEHLATEEAGGLLCHARTSRHSPAAAFRKYVLRPEEGAGCGGEISVFFRVLDASEPGLSGVIDKAIASFPGDRAAWLVMEVTEKNDGAAPLFEIVGNDEPGMSRAGPLFASLPVCIETDGRLLFSEPLASDGFVFVFGGGHVAQELVPLLARLGFRCVVFDDREEFLSSDLFPRAEKLVRGDFTGIGKYISFAENDYAVIITRGHLWDLEAWAFALMSPAAYIGVIGSKSKHEFVKARLRERGFNDEVINAPRVHAPIGLKIKSETPAEIAVSIAAELVLCRAARRELFYGSEQG